MNPTIDTLEHFSLQEIFDYVTSSLLKQAKRSYSDDLGACVYRSEQGLKCAIGFLIPDSLYHPDFEGQGITCILLELCVALPYSTQYFLTRLQTIHDDFEVDDWKAQFKNLAEEYCLDFNGI